ncbi:hypothetical protein OROGR_016485 [Orobanche gracilis]
MQNWPYQPNDIVTKLEEVCLWKFSKPKRQGISWQPPPHNVLKWNVDGSSNGKPGNAGIGGVLRDHNGLILCKFAASVGIKDSNEAEFLAIIFAVETSLKQPRSMEKDLIIESDSSNAVSWIKRKRECPWSLREANHIADALAKQGARANGRLVD